MGVQASRHTQIRSTLCYQAKAQASSIDIEENEEVILNGIGN
uniref:Uncharacterized protein n=2 Tax=Oryza sativa subsp. japonica TaxID=39947 RepID=Q53L17_ORYSJ|nr:hypothetical protein LOC_Os11g15380 [Oryza sativa Japonica Group]ABA92541.1 hypothetical protein LOC_Os11g15379 [Oryza sativa Japonica Group]